MESGGLEISRLARDIAESIGHQEGDTMPSALRMEFVQRVLDKAEAIGGFDFSAYEDDDDDDFDDGDDFDDDDDDEDLESDGNFGDGDDDD